MVESIVGLQHGCLDSRLAPGMSCCILTTLLTTLGNVFEMNNYSDYFTFVVSFLFFFCFYFFFQQMSKLKQENEKLKAENRALTRVVSKLTNK